MNARLICGLNLIYRMTLCFESRSQCKQKRHPKVAFFMERQCRLDAGAIGISRINAFGRLDKLIALDAQPHDQRAGDED